MPSTPAADKHSLLRGPLLALLIFRVLRSLAAGMITIAFPYLVLQDLRLSALALGLIYTAATVATALFGLTFGVLADVWGRRKTLLVVAVMLPLSAGLVVVGHSLPLLFAAAVVGGYSATGSLMGGGVGGAAMPIQTAVLASLLGSERRTFYFSFFTFVSGMAAAFGVLAAKPFSNAEIFAAATVLSGLSALLVLPLDVPEHPGQLRRLKSLKTIGKFSATGILNGFTQGLITPFLVPFFLLVYGLSKEQMAGYGFFAGALGSISLLAAPWLDKKMGFVRAIAVTRGLGAILVALLPVIGSLKLALAFYILIPPLRVAALPAQQRALTDMVESDETGRALGINQVTRLAASSGATTATGVLFSEMEFAPPFFVYAGLMVVNIYLYFRFFGRSPERFAGAPREEA